MKVLMRFLITIAFLLPVTFSCGNPEVRVPDPLSVVFFPLDGVINVEPDVSIEIYFSGDVASDSVTKGSVFLHCAPFDGTSCGTWELVDLVPKVDDDEPRVVIGSVTGGLKFNTCYRITCTTEVRGVELGALVDLGLAGKVGGRKGVGAEAIFRTKP